MRDDLDYEEQTRGKKSKDNLVKSIIKNAFAPLVVADTLKNAALTKDTKIKDAWKKSFKDYPDSAFDNNVEGIDVITSHFPEFSSDNPGTAALLGLLTDIADPMSYGLTKIASKAKFPATLAQGTMKLGDNIANAGTEAWVKKLTKKKDMKSVKRLTDYIKKNDLRGELRHPENLIEALDGKYDVNESKIAEGSLDATGQEIVRTARNADLRGAKKVNRGDIFRKMKRAVEAQNADDTVSGIVKTDPYLGKLQEVIKPFKKEKIIEEGIPPVKPVLTPAIPRESVEESIAKLRGEVEKIKSASKPKDGVPAIPAEAQGGRDLESVLAELSDAQASKKNLANSNNKIKGENSEAVKKYGIETKAAAPKTKHILTDRVSKLEDMWRLKVDARKKLRQADWDANIKNLPEHKQMVMAATQEIDDQIMESLKDIHFKEGNAADIYRALNDEFGTQSDFLELVVDDTIAKWKGAKTKGGALPALTGGVAAAIAAKTGGGNVPLSTIAGATAGEAARRGFGLSHEMKASIGDRLSRPEAAHIATQTGIEALEVPSEHERTGTDREVENQTVDQGEPMSIGEEDMSPEIRKIYEESKKGSRKPQSVEEAPMPPQAPVEADPIDQKMTHVLMPEKPQWDPYINEEVLNTFLPRDSKRILANPTALMAKVQQVAPNQVPVVQEMLDNDPDGMSEAGPKIAMMFPTMFEKDKYGAFDGKIIDPQMQQKFLSDLAQDEDMDAIEKAGLAMKVQRGESIHS